MTNKKRDFTIERNNGLERTVVGRDGQVHHPTAIKSGRDGRFSSKEEGKYRRAIEKAVAENSQTPSQTTRRRVKQENVIRMGPLEYDSFGLLPADGFGRLSSEDY